jgi:hypothetical protein
VHHSRFGITFSCATKVGEQARRAFKNCVRHDWSLNTRPRAKFGENVPTSSWARIQKSESCHTKLGIFQLVRNRRLKGANNSALMRASTRCTIFVHSQRVHRAFIYKPEFSFSFSFYSPSLAPLTALVNGKHLDREATAPVTGCRVARTACSES